MSFARFGFRTLRAVPPTRYQHASLLARRHLSSEARKLIDDAVTTNPLVLFMKGTPEQPQCGFSRAVCQILDVQHAVQGITRLTSQGVSRETIKSFNCLADQELREGIKEYSDWPTIPQLYVKGEFVGGCDIVLSMHQSGELEKLLAKEGLAPPLDQAVE